MSSQKISVTTPKTGMAKRIREWTATRQTPFTVSDVCDGLGARGKTRMMIRSTVADFLRRGEIRLKTEDGRRNRYLYNHNRRRKETGCLKPRVIKAMYVSTSAFSSADIQRISGVTDRSYVDRIMRRLQKEGYIHRIGKRPCAHGRGAVQLYNIANRDRFRVEVM